MFSYMGFDHPNSWHLKSYSNLQQPSVLTFSLEQHSEEFMAHNFRSVKSFTTYIYKFYVYVMSLIMHSYFLVPEQKNSL